MSKEFKVRLRKINSSHQNLRTEVVSGITMVLPQVGRSFQMMSEPLASLDDDQIGIRFVRTTEVQSVERESNVLRFHTENSYYELQIL